MTDKNVDTWYENLTNASHSQIGKFVSQWGTAMGMVYQLPESLDFEDHKTTTFMLALLNGDEVRANTLCKVIKRKQGENFFKSDKTLKDSESALKALKELEKIGKKRNALIHGVPTVVVTCATFPKDQQRNGVYMVQKRETDSDKQFFDVQTEIESLLESLDEICRQLYALTWREPEWISDR
jgi:hypothetical protein